MCKYILYIKCSSSDMSLQQAGGGYRMWIFLVYHHLPIWQCSRNSPNQSEIQHTCSGFWSVILFFVLFWGCGVFFFFLGYLILDIHPTAFGRQGSDACNSLDMQVQQPQMWPNLHVSKFITFRFGVLLLFFVPYINLKLSGNCSICTWSCSCVAV